MNEFRGRSDGTPSSGSGCAWWPLLVGILVIGLVIQLFQWIGERIALRFGDSNTLTASALLVISLVVMSALTYRSVARRAEFGGWVPVMSWLIVFAAILFLPDSIGLGDKARLASAGSPEATAQASADQADDSPAHPASTQLDLEHEIEEQRQIQAQLVADNASLAEAIDRAKSQRPSSVVGAESYSDPNGAIFERTTFECQGGDIWHIEEALTDARPARFSVRSDVQSAPVLGPFKTKPEALARICPTLSE